MAASKVVAGTLQLNSLSIHVLFDLSATHLLVSNKLVGGIWRNPCRIENRFIISTSLCKTVNVDHMYKGVQINIGGCELKVDLLPLELHDFDVILGMKWLSMNKAQMDSFTNTITLQGPNGKKIVFRGREMLAQTVLSQL